MVSGWVSLNMLEFAESFHAQMLYSCFLTVNLSIFI